MTSIIYVANRVYSFCSGAITTLFTRWKICSGEVSLHYLHRSGITPIRVADSTGRMWTQGLSAMKITSERNLSATCEHGLSMFSLWWLQNDVIYHCVTVSWRFFGICMNLQTKGLTWSLIAIEFSFESGMLFETIRRCQFTGCLHIYRRL